MYFYDIVSDTEGAGEDQELSEIEEKKLRNSNGMFSATTNSNSYPQNGGVQTTPTGTPQDVTDGRSNEYDEQQEDNTNNTSSSYQERGVDVPFERTSRFKENLNNNRSFSKSTGDVRSGSGLRRNPSFTKRGIDRSVSVSDVAKKFENNEKSSSPATHDEDDDNNTKQRSDVTITKSTSTSNLQRKRSFTKSTNPTFVSSIRDKVRSSLRRKPKNDTDSFKENKENDKKAAKEESEKKKSKAEESDKKANVVIKRGASTRASFTVKTSTEKHAPSTPNVATTKIGPNNEIKMSVQNKTRNGGNTKDNGRYGGSTLDVSADSGTPIKSVNKNLSGSAGDVRASFRIHSARSVKNNANNATAGNSGTDKTPEIKASYNTTSTRQSVNRSATEYNRSSATSTNSASVLSPREKSNFVRATPTHGKGSNDPRSSVRSRNTTDVRSSVRKSTDNRPVVAKSASVRNVATNNTSNVSSTATRNQSARTLTPRDNGTAKRTGAGLRRSNSRASSVRGSNQSSATSTPNISRENSKTNMKIPIRRQPGSSSTASINKTNTPRKAALPTASTPEEKDILRIAKAFQKATSDIEKAKDNVEQFMINVALDDIEASPNDRLCIDKLYDHIRHRMIMSQEQIFDGYRSDIRVDMSQYFELFFTALASNMSRVGCEIVTDSTTQQKVCYLTHVKLATISDVDESSPSLPSSSNPFVNGVLSGSGEHESRELIQTESDDDMQASYV